MNIVNKIRNFLSSVLNLNSEKELVPAVHMSDINQLLESMDLLEDVESGEWQCHSCKCQISTESIGKVSGKFDEIVMFCDSYTCMYDTFRDSQREPPETEYDIDEKWTPETVLVEANEAYTNRERNTTQSQYNED